VETWLEDHKVVSLSIDKTMNRWNSG